MSAYIGIDPGMSGYLCVLTDESGVHLEPTPTLPTGKGSARRYNVPELLRVVGLAAAKAEHAVIEKQQSMPQQGVASTFKTGFGYGLWVMALTAAEVPFEAVSSSSWKAKLRIKALPGPGTAAQRKKAAKSLAIETAQRLYPHVNLYPTERSRVPSADMAEALLLAHFARHRATGRPL